MITKDDFSRYMVVPVDRIVKAEWNYKQEDAKQRDKLINNMQRNGQVENTIVRELEDGTMEMVNGNHRLDVFNELGMTEILVYNLGKNVPDEMAFKIAIETNETRFKSDPNRMAQVVDSIIDEFGKGDLLETLPFNEAQIDEMISMAAGTIESKSSGDSGDKAGASEESDPAPQPDPEPDTSLLLNVKLSEEAAAALKDFIYFCSQLPIGDTGLNKRTKVMNTLLDRLESIPKKKFTYDAIMTLFPESSGAPKKAKTKAKEEDEEVDSLDDDFGD